MPETHLPAIKTETLLLFFLFWSTHDGTSIFPQIKSLLKIFTHETQVLFFFTLSGAWVAMGWRTEDKSGLFFLTGNSQTEQH